MGRWDAPTDDDLRVGSRDVRETLSWKEARVFRTSCLEELVASNTLSQAENVLGHATA